MQCEVDAKYKKKKQASRALLPSSTLLPYKTPMAGQSAAVYFWGVGAASWVREAANTLNCFGDSKH